MANSSGSMEANNSHCDAGITSSKRKEKGHPVGQGRKPEIGSKEQESPLGATSSLWQQAWTLPNRRPIVRNTPLMGPTLKIPLLKWPNPALGDIWGPMLPCLVEQALSWRSDLPSDRKNFDNQSPGAPEQSPLKRTLPCRHPFRGKEPTFRKQPLQYPLSGHAGRDRAQPDNSTLDPGQADRGDRGGRNRKRAEKIEAGTPSATRRVPSAGSSDCIYSD